MTDELKTKFCGVRWLADACELPAEDLPEPVLISTLLQCKDMPPALTTYLSWWLDHPDPGSSFERRTRFIRWLPLRMLVHLMLWMGYDGLIYARGHEIGGHIFFQRHGSTLRAFSIALAGKFQGRGLSSVILMDFVAQARGMHGIAKSRFGTGHNRVAMRALEILRAKESHLPLSVGADGWIVFDDHRRASDGVSQ